MPTGSASGSADADGERGLDLGRGMERAKDGDRRDRRAGKRRRHVAGDARETKNVDVDLLPGVAQLLERGAVEVPQAEIERLARDRLRDDLAMALVLVPDPGRAEIGAVRVKALSDQQIDMA